MAEWLFRRKLAGCLGSEVRVRWMGKLPFKGSQGWTAGKRQIAARFRALGQRPDWPITCHSAPESERQVAATSRYAGIHLAALHPLRWRELRPHSEACPICPQPVSAHRDRAAGL